MKTKLVYCAYSPDCSMPCDLKRHQHRCCLTCKQYQAECLGSCLHVKLTGSEELLFKVGKLKFKIEKPRLQAVWHGSKP